MLWYKLEAWEFTVRKRDVGTGFFPNTQEFAGHRSFAQSHEASVVSSVRV